MSNENIKTCPFCGGEPQKSWIPMQMVIPQTVGGYAIMCKKCFAFQLIGAKSEIDAIANWNNRCLQDESF